MPIGVRCSSVELPSKWKRTPNSLAAQKCIHLLLSHVHFVEVVPVADDLAGGCLYVGFVEDYCVCFLRGFTRRRIQIQLTFLFTLDDSCGDISWPRKSELTFHRHLLTKSAALMKSSSGTRHHAPTGDA